MGKIPQTEEPGGLQSTGVTKELDTIDVTEHTHTQTHTQSSMTFFWVLDLDSQGPLTGTLIHMKIKLSANSVQDIFFLMRCEILR